MQFQWILFYNMAEWFRRKTEKINTTQKKDIKEENNNPYVFFLEME